MTQTLSCSTPLESRAIIGQVSFGYLADVELSNATVTQNLSCSIPPESRAIIGQVSFGYLAKVELSNAAVTQNLSCSMHQACPEVYSTVVQRKRNSLRSRCLHYKKGLT